MIFQQNLYQFSIFQKRNTNFPMFDIWRKYIIFQFLIFHQKFYTNFQHSKIYKFSNVRYCKKGFIIFFFNFWYSTKGYANLQYSKKRFSMFDVLRKIMTIFQCSIFQEILDQFSNVQYFKIGYTNFPIIDVSKKLYQFSNYRYSKKKCSIFEEKLWRLWRFSNLQYDKEGYTNFLVF